MGTAFSKPPCDGRNHLETRPIAWLRRVNFVTVPAGEFGPIKLCRPRQHSVVNFFHPRRELFEVVRARGLSIVVSDG